MPALVVRAMAAGVDIGALAVAYQQQFEAVRNCEQHEPPYEDMAAHQRWEVSLAELREDLGKAHLEIDLAVFVDQMPASGPTAHEGPKPASMP